MDPHEKVSMDAEQIMSGSWDFEIMVKQTFKKLARTIKFHITPLGPEAETMMEEPVEHTETWSHIYPPPCRSLRRHQWSVSKA